mgnify:CR=1 FL=1
MTEMLFVLAALAAIQILRNIVEVIREKIALSQNTVVIEGEHITEKDIERAEIKLFMIQGMQIRAGDKIKVITKFKEKLEGMVLGVDTRSDAIVMSMEEAVIDIQVEKIKEIRMVSRYGKFFP